MKRRINLLLEAHGHVVVGYISKVPISLAMIQIDDFKNTLSLLKQYISLLILILFNKLISNISQLKQKQRNLILIHLDLFVV